MKRLAILGASGHGKVVADVAELCGWDVAFFDDAFPDAQYNGAWAIEGGTDELLQQADRFAGVIVAIGHNRTRLAKLRLLRDKGFPIETLVHPQACVSRHAVVESGCVVFAGAVVNAFARVGEGCILNTLCGVDHDAVLDAGVHVSPGACLAGGVRIGEATWIGIGASVRQLVNIGANVVVGAGAAVVGELPDNVTVVGIPARIVS
ncbi:Acetyltransferase [Pseudomonas sp. 8BK]|uniref:NeuD/PglB/VioB family sugar acetyltransferase n=1 Tax=Pseudomonas sp. 8BK TaxID=2653164 RepID=UPI0012F2FB99|nr:NeuD/PglB/VioB family sugar acetyltransferase [Pseudomonas sp. 8BK]VXC24879.1 Acetyltransferase [Pseudomonas sp. 8BK]